MKTTPVHLVIGRDGRVIFAGHQDGAALDVAIKQALASKASPAGVATIRLDLAARLRGSPPPCDLFLSHMVRELHEEYAAR